MNDIIRVFPRRTKWTPTDDLAFVGEPPLFELPNLPVYVSVTFTWDIKKANHIAASWIQRLRSMKSKCNWSIGGPAFINVDCGLGEDFVPGRFIKEGVTITSRGCTKQCPWCLVWRHEGKLREINVAPGYMVQDNNLLACSCGHIERVFDMLRQQKKGAIFSGGLDIDYLESSHVELLKSIRVDELWVACDCERDLSRLDKAVDLLADFSIEKKRCYVLMGFGDDTPEKANRRCETIYTKGFLPFAQFFRPEGMWRGVPNEWRYVQRKWSRPAMYRSKKEQRR